MAKTKISEFSATPGNNTDIDGINIAEGCAPSGINDAIRELMSQLKDFQAGTAGDSFNGPVGTTTAAAGAFTTLSSTGNTTLGDAAGDTVTVNGTATFANANPTLSAGTANGVAYLNGSKVLTTGSALVFDGTNLGLGGTPSAWGASFKALQIGSTGSVYASAGNALLANNYYNDGTNSRYLTTAPAGAYLISANTHYWYTAPSGTAGNAISFTQAMTLDASGNLGVGTTSPQGRLEVVGASSTTGFVRWSDGVAATGFLGVDSVSPFINSNNGILRFGTSASNALTERARIDSSGFFKTKANGGSYFNGSYNEILNNNNVSGDIVLVVGNKAGSNTNNTSSYFLIASDNAADRFYIYGNGNVVNVNNSYGALSDIKLKENITDATPKLEKLQQVRVVNYNVKGETQKQIGVIAQELEQIFPGMVDESPDRDAEGNDLGTTTKAVKYSVFVPMLIKAMQEQHAIINQINAKVEAQAAEIAALKGQA